MPYNHWARRHDTSYRSGLEDVISAQLKSLSIPVLYETHILKYTIPEALHRYTPDFILPNGIIVETKGRFTPQDRKKMALVVAQNPDLDIRMVFSNANTKISKASKTTYAIWCEKQGIQYASKAIPAQWLNEPSNHRALALLSTLLKKKASD